MSGEAIIHILMAFARKGKIRREPSGSGHDASVYFNGQRSEVYNSRSISTVRDNIKPMIQQRPQVVENYTPQHNIGFGNQVGLPKKPIITTTTTPFR